MGLESLYLEHIDHHPLGILLEILIFIYCFCALAIICDSYLVCSLETFCVRWKIREDVAGATILALGSSAPELIISSVNTIAGESDLGVGAIIGSGMLAFSVLPGLMALAAGRDLVLKRRPLARDSLTYLTALILLTVFFGDGFIDLYESIALFSLYIGYIILVVTSPSVREKLIARRRKAEYENQLKSAMENGADRTVIEEIKQKYLSEAVGERKSFVEAAKEQEQELLKTKLKTKTPAIKNNNNNNNNNNDLSSTFLSSSDRSDLDETLNSENNLNDSSNDLLSDDGIIEPSVYEVEDEIRDEPQSQSKLSKIWRFTTWPLSSAFHATCIDCAHDKPNAKYYPLTFFVAFLWVSLFSFTISAVSGRFNEISGLPLSLFGIVLVAAGAEVPDGVQSLSVAKRGYGSMAVSNSCGAQITNILFGLGFPWLIANIVGYGEGTRKGFQCEVNDEGELIHSGCVSAPVDSDGMVPWRGVQIREHEDALIAALFQFGNLSLFIGLLLIAAVAQGHKKAVLTRKKGLFMLGFYLFVIVGFCITSQVIIKPATENQWYAPLDD